MQSHEHTIALMLFSNSRQLTIKEVLKSRVELLEQNAIDPLNRSIQTELSIFRAILSAISKAPKKGKQRGRTLLSVTQWKYLKSLFILELAQLGYRTEYLEANGVPEALLEGPQLRQHILRNILSSEPVVAVEPASLVRLDLTPKVPPRIGFHT